MATLYRVWVMDGADAHEVPIDYPTEAEARKQAGALQIALDGLGRGYCTVVNMRAVDDATLAGAIAASGDPPLEAYWRRALGGDTSVALQSLASVSIRPVDSLIMALSAAVCVLGDDMVMRALDLMAKRPPPYRASWRSVGDYRLYTCAGCHATMPDCNEPFKRNGAAYCEPSCYYGRLGEDPDGAALTFQRRLIARINRETCQGTPVAANKQLPPYRLHIEDEPDEWSVYGGRILRERITAKTARDWSGVRYTFEPELTYEPERPIQPKPSLAPAIAASKASLERQIAAALQAAREDPGTDEDASVEDALTPAVEALMAAGGVAEAQKGILEALDKYPLTRPPVMPMPRAGSTPNPLLRPGVDLSGAQTGKPCRVCMKPAYCVVERDGKARHYCLDHFDSSGKA